MSEKKKKGGLKVGGGKEGKAKVAKTGSPTIIAPPPAQVEEELEIESIFLGENEEEGEYYTEEYVEESDEEDMAALQLLALENQETEEEMRSSSSSSYEYGDSSSDTSITPPVVCPSGEYSGTSSVTTIPSEELVKPIEYKPSSTENICGALETELLLTTPGRTTRGETSGELDTGTDIDKDTFKEAPDFAHINTYEAYLDHYVTDKDLYYLENEHTARKITTLGFRVPELLTREQFAAKMLEKESQMRSYAVRKDDAHIAYWIPPHQITCPLMKALAVREKLNRTGNMACIIYVRILNHKHQEISGWIDFKLRLAKDGTDLWKEYFTGKKKLMPRPSDLSYYNWTSFQVRYNSSDNYLVTTDVKAGLQFMNKFDRKLITINPKVPPGDNTDAIQIKSPHYLDCAVLDHSLRVKA